MDKLRLHFVLLSEAIKARFKKNVRPQCNATFMATAQSSTIVEKWYSIFLKTVAKCNILIYTFQCLPCSPSEL